MKQVIGVQYSQYGQIIPCLYDPAEGGDPIKYNDLVIVETEEEKLFARVAWQRPYCDEVLPATPKVYFPSKEEEERALENEALSASARKFCNACIRNRELEMKIVDVALLSDKSKLIFYFTAPTRIDFRELVKDLVREYRTRIELRQIGVRHETQMVGSLGNCGMICCCRRYLTTFAPVTIKMAKEQNLFLNPTKISGICGRLLCCLSYEQEGYEIFHKSCPKLGKRYHTDQGYMRVLRANMFRNTIAVLPESGPEIELNLDEWATLNPQRQEPPPQEHQNKQAKTYTPEPFINCSVDPEMIENDPDLRMFDAEFSIDYNEGE